MCEGGLAAAVAAVWPIEVANCVAVTAVCLVAASSGDFSILPPADAAVCRLLLAVFRLLVHLRFPFAVCCSRLSLEFAVCR